MTESRSDSTQQKEGIITSTHPALFISAVCFPSPYKRYIVAGGGNATVPLRLVNGTPLHIEDTSSRLDQTVAINPYSPLFVFSGNTWKRVVDTDDKKMAVRNLEESVTLGVIPFGTTGKNQQLLYHIGINTVPKTSWLPSSLRTPPETPTIAELLAHLIGSQYSLAGNLLQHVRLLPPTRTRTIDPLTLIRRIQTNLLQRPVFQQAHIGSPDLQGEYRGIVSNLHRIQESHFL